MVEQGTPAPAQAPPAPNAPITNRGVPRATPGKFDGLSYGELKVREQELKRQRQDLADRRSRVVDQHNLKSDPNSEGITERLKVMDANMARIESDIAAVGDRMVATVQVPTEPPARPIIVTQGWHPDEVAALGFSTFLGTLLLTVFFMRRFTRRRMGSVNPPTGETAIQSGERLNRIEQAVDTIAVEIERVSENQRFMTRLMTETQLGASLAAVRSSTEMAKSAAESPPDGLPAVR